MEVIKSNETSNMFLENKPAVPDNAAGLPYKRSTVSVFAVKKIVDSEKKGSVTATTVPDYTCTCNNEQKMKISALF